MSALVSYSCPKCRGDLVEDENRGDTVCIGCGLVVEERGICFDAYVGSPTVAEHMEEVVSPPSGPEKAFSPPSDLAVNENTPHLDFDLGRFDQVADHLADAKFPAEIFDIAKEIFRIASRLHIHFPDVDTTLAVCIFTASRLGAKQTAGKRNKGASSLSAKDLCKLLAVEVKPATVLRLHRRLSKMVPAAARVAKETLSCSTSASKALMPCCDQPENVEAVVARTLISLGITSYAVLSECEALAKALITAAVSSDALVDPPCLAAAAIYLVGKRDGLPISRSVVSVASGVPEQDLTTWVRENSSAVAMSCSQESSSSLGVLSLSPTRSDDSNLLTRRVRFTLQPVVSMIR